MADDLDPKGPDEEELLPPPDDPIMPESDVPREPPEERSDLPEPKKTLPPELPPPAAPPQPERPERDGAFFHPHRTSKPSSIHAGPAGLARSMADSSHKPTEDSSHKPEPHPGESVAESMEDMPRAGREPREPREEADPLAKYLLPKGHPDFSPTTYILPPKGPKREAFLEKWDPLGQFKGIWGREEGGAGPARREDSQVPPEHTGGGWASGGGKGDTEQQVQLLGQILAAIKELTEAVKQSKSDDTTTFEA